MINILKKIKNDKNYRVKVEQELKNRLLFFNISNKNVRNFTTNF